VFVGAVAALVISQVMLYFGAGNLFALLMALVVFFSAFNVMEASLPSLNSKVAPAEVKGTAIGVYSSLQFLGIFIGGIIGGMAHQRGGSAGVFGLTTALAAIWLLAAVRMAQPSYLTARLAAAWPKQGRGRWSRRPIAAGPSWYPRRRTPAQEADHEFATQA
jgi:predicted MFS family arabinose efflux permease